MKFYEFCDFCYGLYKDDVIGARALWDHILPHSNIKVNYFDINKKNILLVVDLCDFVGSKINVQMKNCDLVNQLLYSARTLQEPLQTSQ